MKRWSISTVPPEALEAVATVLTYGATVYGRDKWLTSPSAWTARYDSVQRHLLAWARGEDTDESGFPAIAHAAAQLLLLIAMIQREIGTDDRASTVSAPAPVALKEPVAVVKRRRRTKRLGR